MASTVLSRTQTNGTSSKIFTTSIWFKRSPVTNVGNQPLWSSSSSTGDALDLLLQGNGEISFEDTNGNAPKFVTSRKLVDPSAFYNVVIAVDSTQAIDTNRVKIYLNGVQETAFGTATLPTQNMDFAISTSADTMKFGSGGQGPSNFFNGLMSYVAFVDGTAYTPTSFGEVNAASGIWKINTAPSVTYGNNGFFLKMDTTSPGSDTSGNDNTFTAAGTPTLAQDNASNNLTTLNPLLDVNAVPTFLNGNTTIVGSSSGGARLSGSSISVGTGKWYYEIKTTVDGSQPYIGVIDAQSNIRRNSSYFVAATSGSNDSGYAVNMSGDIYYNNSSTYASNIGSISTGNILGFAVDLTSTQKTCTIYKNGTSMRTFNLANPSSDNYMLGVCSISNSASAKCEVNFGNGFFGVTAVASSNADAAGHGLFEYAVPTGFFTINTKNLNTYGG